MTPKSDPVKHVILPKNTTSSAKTWEEIGFAEFPIVTTSLKRPPFDTLEYLEDLGQDKQGQDLHRQWKVVGSKEYGLPRLADLDVFVAILKLLEDHDYRDRVIYCTLKDICDIVGLTAGGTTYQRVKDALLRFATTTYVSDRVFHDRKSGDTIGLETWELIVESRFTNDGKQGVLPSYFEVSKRFLEKIKNGQMKPIDLTLWRELPLGLEKPIYHYLDKNLYGGKSKHEIGLCKLGKKIALTGKYYPSDLLRLYKKPLANLVKLGFLDSYQFVKTSSKTDPVKLIVFPGSRARTTRRTPPVATAPTSQLKSLAEGLIAPSTTPLDARRSADNLVRHWREVMGHPIEGRITVTDRRSMITLLDQCQGDFEHARYAVEYAAREFPNMKTTTGVLQGNYPERARQDYAKKKADKAAAQDISQARVRHLAEEERQHQALECAWQGLAEEEREQLVEKAKASLLKSVDSAHKWTPEALEGTATYSAKQELAKRLTQ